MNVTLEQVELGLRVAALALAVIWLVMVLDRKRWWPSQWSLHLGAAAHEPRPGEYGKLVAVIPAHNEASTLPRTLPRFLKQSAWLHRIVVVDDRSQDKTSSCAHRLADGTPAEHLLHVERVAETEQAWATKTYAMQRGYEAAVRDWPGDPARQWILFTDADILHPTFSMSRLMAKVGGDEVDLVSVMVRLRARSFWEWILIPAYTYFFQLMHPFRKVSSRAHRSAAAAAGVILVRRSALEDAGGFEAIKDHVDDGLALARLIKQAGGNCWLGLDPDLSSVRTYDAYSPIHDKVTRTAFEHLGRSFWRVPLTVLALGALYVLPPLLMIYGAVRLDATTATAAGLAWLLSLATYLPVVQYLGVPSGLTLTLPLAACLYAALTVASAWRHMLGRGPRWRTPTETDLTG